MNSASTSRALIVAIGGLGLLLSLAGCGSNGAGAATPAPTVTVTATATPTPAATAAAPSPDDPIDAFGAWDACAVLGLAEYAAQNPGSELRPYDPAHPPTRNADGTFQAIASFTLPTPVEGANSIVAICTIGGTLGHPTLVNWTLKDV